MVLISRSLLTFVAAKSNGRVFHNFGSGRQCITGFCSDSADSAEGSGHKFEVVRRQMAYSGWRKIMQKTVKIEDDKEYIFDVIHQDEPSVAVFVWHTRSKSLTLLKEFAPGREAVNHGVVAGLYERGKHESPLQAAKYELEEEAHLRGGTWYPLGQDAETTINLDKYSSNEFYCWLVVDPFITSTPRPMDDEEFIEIERDISMERAMDLLAKGKMSLVSGFVILSAARKLRKLGLLDREY